MRSETKIKRIKEGVNSQVGRLDMSAETAQGIPKLERTPLMIPHGKYRYMLTACAALLSPGVDGSSVSFSDEGSIETRDSHLNLLSCNTKVP